MLEYEIHETISQISVTVSRYFLAMHIIAAKIERELKDSQRSPIQVFS